MSSQFANHAEAATSIQQIADESAAQVIKAQWRYPGLIRTLAEHPMDRGGGDRLPNGDFAATMYWAEEGAGGIPSNLQPLVKGAEWARTPKWERLAEQWARAEGEEVSLDMLPPVEDAELVEIVEALIENRNEVYVMNVPNQGAIENLCLEPLSRSRP